MGIEPEEGGVSHAMVIGGAGGLDSEGYSDESVGSLCSVFGDSVLQAVAVRSLDPVAMVTDAVVQFHKFWQPSSAS